MNPQISVIIPCFNQGKYLEQCINSVRNQSFTNWEIILINDGSTDETCDIGNKWQKLDSRIKYYYQQNSGLSAARNFGIVKSNSDIISLLDADDLFEEEYLSLVVKAFNKGASLTFSGYRYFLNEKLILHTVKFNQKFVFDDILLLNILPPVAVAFNKKLLNSVGYFDISLKSAEDWDLWIRFYKIGVKPQIISNGFVLYRIVENSMSRNAFRMYHALREVSNRSLKKDTRLPIELINNRDYNEIDLGMIIKRNLVMCLGVSVMQGQIIRSIELFNEESKKYLFKWTPYDFEPMCSYLSFRYRNSKEDIEWIFREIEPLFVDFFKLSGLEEINQKVAIKKIFLSQNKMRNFYKYGLMSKIINLIFY